MRFRRTQPSESEVDAEFARMRVMRTIARRAHEQTYTAGFRAGVEETLSALEREDPPADVEAFIAATRQRLEAEDDRG